MTATQLVLPLPMIVLSLAIGMHFGCYLQAALELLPGAAMLHAAEPRLDLNSVSPRDIDARNPTRPITSLDMPTDLPASPRLRPLSSPIMPSRSLAHRGSVSRYHMGDRYGAFMWYPRWSVRRALLVLSVRSVLVADYRFVSAPKGRAVTTR